VTSPGSISEYGEVAPSGDDLRIDSHQQADGTMVLGVCGELDLASACTMENALSRAAGAGAKVIVLDLADLEFVDSSGISVLVRAQLRATREGRRLVLRNLSVQVARVLAVSGVDATFTLDDDAA
jgi:anti-sigma B factor antagonist